MKEKEKKFERKDLYCPACRSYIDNQDGDMQKMMKDLAISCQNNENIHSKKLCVYFRLKPEKSELLGGESEKL